MDKIKALAIIKQVASEFVGNLRDHNQIQEAILALEKELGLSQDTKSDKK